MKRKLSLSALRCLAVLLFLLSLTACGTKGFSITGEPELSQPDYVRTPPEVPMWTYTPPDMQAMEEAAEAQEAEAAATAQPPYRYDGPDGSWEYQDEQVHAHQNKDGRFALIDFSHAADGYVVVVTKHKYRVRVYAMPPEVKARPEVNQYYSYEVPNDGTPTAFPLSYGSTTYNYMVYLNQSADPNDTAVQFLAGEVQLSVSNEFGPFLVPSGVVNYTPDASVVQLAHQLTANCTSDVEVLQQIYYWVTQNISYDTEKAEKVGTMPYYVPNLNEILEKKIGICYDYASLIAAMLRANGIPCKMVFGNAYADDDVVYHAWNEIWMEETGWITVGVPITSEVWQRIDTTFAASGQMGINKLIGDGNNYLPRYYH